MIQANQPECTAQKIFKRTRTVDREEAGHRLRPCLRHFAIRMYRTHVPSCTQWSFLIFKKKQNSTTVRSRSIIQEEPYLDSVPTWPSTYRRYRADLADQDAKA
eukprot:SAG31_NODE_5419_length_2548_cov_1.752552_3_plen_103_part_00